MFEVTAIEHLNKCTQNISGSQIKPYLYADGTSEEKKEVRMRKVVDGRNLEVVEEIGLSPEIHVSTIGSCRAPILYGAIQNDGKVPVKRRVALRGVQEPDSPFKEI